MTGAVQGWPGAALRQTDPKTLDQREFLRQMGGRGYTQQVKVVGPGWRQSRPQFLFGKAFCAGDDVAPPRGIEAHGMAAGVAMHVGTAVGGGARWDRQGPRARPGRRRAGAG